MFSSVRNRFGAFTRLIEGSAAYAAERLPTLERAMKGWPEFKSFDIWPADAQLALLSMGWVIGPKISVHGGFGSFTALRQACAVQNFWAASAACAMGMTGHPGMAARNRANAALFINAACVVAGEAEGRYHRPTLYYPIALAVQEDGDPTQAHAGRGAMRAVQLLTAQSRLAAMQKKYEEQSASSQGDLSQAGEQRRMLDNLTSMTTIGTVQLTGGKSDDFYKSMRYNRLIKMELEGLRNGTSAPLTGSAGTLIESARLSAWKTAQAMKASSRDGMSNDAIQSGSAFHPDA